MSFKLRLLGYSANTPPQEYIGFTDSAIVNITKLLRFQGSIGISEGVVTHLGTLDDAIITGEVNQLGIEESTVVDMREYKTALPATIGFTHFPTYYIVERVPELQLVTFLGTSTTWKQDTLLSSVCGVLPKYSTNIIKHAPDDFVGGKYHTGKLGVLTHTDHHHPRDISTLLGRTGLNMHQLTKVGKHPNFDVDKSPQGDCLPFGVITKDTIITTGLASGEAYDLRIVSILIPSWMGVELVGLNEGDILRAGELLTLTVKAFGNLGRRDVRDFFTIKFEEVEYRDGHTQQVSICVDIHRRQVADFMIVPDKGSYAETIEYSTMEFASVNNIRKTKPKMINWKYSVKYSVTMHTTRAHKVFMNIMRGAKRDIIQHPLWGQVTLLKAQVNTSTYCPVDTRFCDFREGDYVYVFVGNDSYYLRQLKSIVDTGLVFERTFSAPLGALVMPAFPALVKGDISSSYIGERFQKGTVTAMEFREGVYNVPY